MTLVDSLIPSGGGDIGSAAIPTFKNIAQRDSFFSSAENSQLLENGLPVIVNQGNAVTTFIWEGTDNPTTYDADLFVEQSLNSGPGTVFLGLDSANISSAGKAINFESAYGDKAIFNGTLFDTGGSVKPSEFIFSKEITFINADVFDSQLVGPFSFSIASVGTTYTGALNIRPATAGKLTIKGFAGTDDTFPVLENTSITIGAGDIGNIVSVPVEGILVVPGTDLFLTLEGVELFGGLQTSGAFSGLTKPYLESVLQVLTTSHFVNEDDISQYPVLNRDHVTTSVKTGGLLINVLPTSTVDTFVDSTFIPGIASTSNPSLSTTGTGIFVAGEIVLLTHDSSLDTPSSNDGVYEVLTHTGNILTVRGVGVTPTVDDFTKDQFLSQESTGLITKTKVAVLRATDTQFQIGFGSSTPLVFNSLESVTSLTEGSVLFSDSSGDIAQDNANLFYDDTNNVLGVGTNSPNATNLIDMVSTTKSLGFPQMTAVQRDAIVNPRNGSAIYHIEDKDIDYFADEWRAMLNSPASSIGPGGVIFGVGSGNSHAVDDDNDEFFWDNSNKRLALGKGTADVKLDVEATTEQLRLSFDAFNSASFTVTASGVSDASFDSISFSVSSEDIFPQGLAFNVNGTKMYMAGTVGDNIYQYTLATGFDVSTASFDSVSFSVSSEDTDATGIAFNTDGTKMYLSGNQNNAVFQYTLTTGFDLSTASFDSVSLSVSGQTTGPRDLDFNTDGTKLFIIGNVSNTIYQYTLTVGFDLSTALFASISLDVSTEETNVQGFIFSQSGKRLYVVGVDNAVVFQYTLTTGFDLSTATYDNISFSVGSQESQPRAITLSSNDTKFYIVGNINGTVFQYSLGSSSLTIAPPGNNFLVDVVGDINAMGDITSEPDSAVDSGFKINDSSSVQQVELIYDVSADRVELTTTKEFFINTVGNLFEINADTVDITGTTLIEFLTNSGDINISSTSGDVDLISTTGTVLVASTSGLLTVRGGSAGGLTLSSNSGLISVTDDVEITGDFTVDTATLFVDSSTNRVGIGTTSPDQLLDIENLSGSADIRISGAGANVLHAVNTNYDIRYTRITGSPTMEFRAVPSDGTSQALFRFGLNSGSTGPNLLVLVEENGILAQTQLASSGIDSFINRMGGNLSIGHNSPAAKLHVISDSIEQLRLGFDVSNFTSFTVDSGGDLSVAPSGGNLAVDGSLTVEGNQVSRLPTNVHELFSTAKYEDLGVAGVITTSDTRSLQFKAEVISSTSHVLDGTVGDSVELQFIDQIENDRMIYTGTTTFIIAPDGGDITSRNAALIAAIPGTQLFDCVGESVLPGVDIIEIVQSSNLAQWNLGTISRISTGEFGPIVRFKDTNIISTTDPLILDGCTIVEITSCIFGDTAQTGSGGPLFSIKSSAYKEGRATLSSNGGELFSGESLVRIDAGLPNNYRVQVLDSLMILRSGASIFDTSGATGTFTVVVDNEISETVVTGVSDSSGVASFEVTNAPLLGGLATLSGFTTNTDYNKTGIVTSVTLDSITAVTVVVAGSGYLVGEGVSLVGLTSGANNATGIVTAPSGPVTSVTVVDGGSGYTSGETVTIVGDVVGESSASGTITIKDRFEIDFIAFGSDEAGNYLVKGVTITATAHGLTQGTGVTLSTTSSTTYDGGFLIYNIQTNSFDVPLPFDGTEAGTWSTEGLDQSDPRVNASNNPGLANSHSIAGGFVNDNSEPTGTIVNNIFTNMVFGTVGSALAQISTSEEWKMIDEVNATFDFKGLNPFEGFITFDFTVVSSGGEVNFIFKWEKSTDGGISFNDLEDNVEVLVPVGSTPQNVTKTFPLQAIIGNQIRPQVTRNSGTSGITSTYASIYITNPT